ncbi:ABC transporter ATP-binding protein [Natronospora cellulosivora (SeqCode)]
MLLEVNNIQKSYGTGKAKVDALKGVSLAVEEGEMLALIGKSGSGKSTLLNVLGGLDSIDSGEYIFKKKNIENLKMNSLARFRRKNIGFIVQYFALLNDMTVFENIALPYRYNKLSFLDIRVKVKKLLSDMEIEDKENKLPTELSGGERQRVAIARGLACDPELLLVDEPTGALDETTGAMIMDKFLEINKQGITIIIATHDKNIAEKCSRILELKDGELIH